MDIYQIVIMAWMWIYAPKQTRDADKHISNEKPTDRPSNKHINTELQRVFIFNKMYINRL